MSRKPPPTEIEKKVLLLCRRRCCLCYGLNNDLTVKQGQIAHLDGNATHSEIDNLAFLCLPHHDQYDTRTSQSKGLTESEVRHFRRDLHDLIERDPDSLTESKHSNEIRVRQRSTGPESSNVSLPRIAVAVQDFRHGEPVRVAVTNQGEGAEFYAPLEIGQGIRDATQGLFAKWAHTDTIRTWIAKGETCQLIVAWLNVTPYFAQWRVLAVASDHRVKELAAHISSCFNPIAKAPDVYICGSVISKPDAENGIQPFKLILEAFQAVDCTPIPTPPLKSVHVVDTAKLESLTPPNPKVPDSNLVLKRMYSGGLVFARDVWSRNEARAIRHPSPRYRAIFVEIKNDGKEGMAVGPALGIKAELIVAGNFGDEEFVPLPWLDEVYNTVNLQFGDVKSVLLAVNMALPAGQLATSIASITDPSRVPLWCVPLNNRGYPDLTPGISQMDFNHSLYQGSEKKVRLNLLQIKSGVILRTFHGVYKWKDDIFEPEILF